MSSASEVEQRRLPLIFRCGLGLSLFAFAVLIGVLARYNRLAADDFAAIAEVHSYGVIGSVWHSYVGWGGRWMAAFLTRFFGSLSGDSGSLVAYTLLTFLYFISSCALLVRAVIERFARVSVSRLDALLLGGILAQLIYFVTPKASESFHWLCGASCYGWGLSHLFFMAAFALLPGDRRTFTWGAALMGILATASNESLGVLALCVCGLGYLVSKSKGFLHAGIGVFLSFLSVALAPGNWIRKSAMGHQSSFTLALPSSFELTWSFLQNFWVSYRLWYVGVFVLAWTLARLLMKKDSRLADSSAGISLLIHLGLILVLNWVLLFPAVYLGGNLPPDRSWVTNAAVTLLIFASVGATLATHYSSLLRSRQAEVLLVGALSVTLVAIAGYRASLTVRMQDGARLYAKAYDARRDFLLQQKQTGVTEPVFVHPLPGTDHFASADWEVIDLQKAMRLPFAVKLAPGPNQSSR